MMSALTKRAYQRVPVARGPVPRHARYLNQDVAVGL